MRRRPGKRFLATLPYEIHVELMREARVYKGKHGGHLNLNLVIVTILSNAFKAKLSPEKRAVVEAFIARST